MLSVVIPARNAAATLGAQLGALERQTYRGSWELIVVDNGSTDQTGAILERAAGAMPLRIMEVATPGTNLARNAGALAAAGEFLLFLDADDVVAPEWLSAMAAAAERADAVCGALEFMLPGRERTRTLRPWPGFLSFAAGANAGVRASVFRDLGGFDVSYSHGGDDVEFFWRVQLSGYQIEFVPEAIVHYRERDRLRDVARQFFHYGRQDPHLYRDFRAAGMPSSTLVRGIRSWGHLVIRAPWYWSQRDRRRQWVRSASRRLGRISGSVRWRTIYL